LVRFEPSRSRIERMSTSRSALAGWTAEEVARGRHWVETWKHAGTELERIHQDELRRMDAFQAIALLCGPADYTVAPRAPKPTSGLVEQQRLFMRLRRP
jgi:hypothetical protein